MNIGVIKDIAIKNGSRALLIAKKYGPEILMVAGTAAIVEGTIVTAEATLKADEILEENKENKDDMAFMIKGLEMLVGKDASDKIEALDLPIPEYKEMYNTIMQVAMGTYGEEQTPSA